MGKINDIKTLLGVQGLMPLYFHDDINVSLEILTALYDAGARIIEYTNRGENALRNFKELRKKADSEMTGLMLGIGTIKNVAAAKNFADAGADFLVSPAITPRLAEFAGQKEILWIPGCMTPSEILQAEELSVSLVKLFPGNVLGAAYVKAVKDLFPNMKFMPTGGVESTIENLREWFSGGVYAVGMGSKLITNEIVEGKQFDSLRHATEDVLKKIQQVKSADKN